MKNKLSDRIININESKSIRVAAIVEKLRAEGKKIISMSIGEPDFPAPLEIKNAVKEALDQNQTRYSLVPGLKNLRNEIAHFLNKQRHFLDKINLTSENIIVSNGSKQSLYNIFQTLLNPGDEVIIPIPYWVTIPESIKLAGGIPVLVKTKNLYLDLDEIKKKITKKTKAIVYNSPNNPSGMVYSQESLIELANLAIEHDFYLISDEAYDALLFDGQKPFSLASVSQEIFERTITVQTFSKTYSMTGFRIGYLAANIELVQAMDKFQGHLTGNNCTFAQYGAIAALKMNQKTIHEMISTFEARRDLAYKLCIEIFSCVKPTGAFYLFPNVEKYYNRHIKNDEQFSEWLLEKAQVATVAGSAFGMPGHIRFSYATSEEDIKNAFGQIKAALR